jgi:hypothetical protein
MNNLTIVLLMSVALGNTCAPLAAGSSSDSGRVHYLLSNANDAVTKALEITGFKDHITIPIASSDKIARKLLIMEDETPFLSDKIKGKEVWVVKFDSVDIRPEVARNRGDHRWPLKSFDVLLDPRTGQVVKIHAGYTDSSDNVLPEPPSNVAELSLRETGEIYHAFPDSNPKVTFIEALQAAVGCAPVSAKEIIAYLVLHSKGNSTPKPVWCITCRGIPPVTFSVRSEKASEKARNRARCVVDATTGEWMFMTNRPQATDF